MPIRGARVALFLCLASCVSSGGDEGAKLPFRVGATSGLAPVAVGAPLNGSSAAAADLVFDAITEHVDVAEVRGSHLLLRRKPASAHPAEELAASLRFPGLVSARAVDAATIEAVFDDEKAARRCADPSNFFAGFELGPYRLEAQEAGWARLRRRQPGGVDVIQIVEVAASDEWRKLMARELDVMSFSPSLYRDQFDGMRSVRLLDVPAIGTSTLYFNVGDPGLSAAAVRRRIAAGINRPAIARVADGDDRSAVPFREPEAPLDPAPLPERLSLMVNRDDSTLLLAASVLRHQLDRMGVALTVEALPLPQLIERHMTGRYQLALGPLPKGLSGLRRFTSPEPDSPSVTGFADPAFDAAVASGDLEAAQAILDREVPATLLYELRGFAAIDARFCGEVEPSMSSWRWMADLRPCEDGAGSGKGSP